MKTVVFKLKTLFIPCLENNFRPKFLTSHFLLYYLIAVLILKIFGFYFIFQLPKTFFFADLTKSAIIQMTNEKRVSSGLGQLTENQALNQAALEKAQNMLDLDYFAHQSTTGITPWYWFKKAGYKYEFAGENLAIGFLDSKEAVDAWENSPSHKENLLNPNYKEIGIAVLKGDFKGVETNIVVQLFGSQLTEKNKIISQKEPTSLVPSVSLEPKQQIEKKEVAGISEFQLSGFKQEKINKSKYFEFFNFMNLKYPELLTDIIFYSVFFVIVSLILNIFIKIKIQDKGLILKTILLILLMVLFFVTDKSLIFKFIPHNIVI